MSGSYNYSNKTLFGMKTDTERYSLASWNIFVIVCSVIGDTTILISSIKYKTFHHFKILAAFIENIALCDLLNSLGNLVPCTISLISDHQPSDHAHIYPRFALTYYVSTTSCLFVAAMTVTKLLLLKYPLRTGSWSKRQTYRVCVGIWVISLYVPILHLAVDKTDITFDYRTYIYSYRYSSSIWKYLLPFLALLTLLVPNLTIIISTVLLLREARRVVGRREENLRWQGIITVLLTAAVYTLSFLPFTLYCLIEPSIPKDPDKPGTFYIYYFRISGALVCVNVLANFFVYSLTVASFRTFLKKRIWRVVMSEVSSKTISSTDNTFYLRSGHHVRTGVHLEVQNE